jgi:hypothetical protein
VVRLEASEAAPRRTGAPVRGALAACAAVCAAVIAAVMVGQDVTA